MKKFLEIVIIIFLSCSITNAANIVDELTKLNNLTIADLYALTGQIPTEIGELTALTNLHIYASSDKLTGQIPTEIGKLTKVNNLSIAWMSSITGTIPSQIGNTIDLDQKK